MPKTLADTLTPHDKCRISKFEGDPILLERLKEMGLHPGLELEYIGRAPFKGPRLFRFGGTMLALREEEALCIHW